MLTDGYAMIPPIEGTLFESQTAVVFYFFGIWGVTKSPRSQINKHNKKNWKHPLKKLLIG